MKRPLARWQDWAIFAVALWLAVSPWLCDYAAHRSATANAALAGLVIALTAHFEASCELAIDWLNLGAGLWLMAAPFLLGFDALPLATANSLAVGAAIAALAVSTLGLDQLHARLTGASQAIRR